MPTEGCEAGYVPTVADQAWKTETGSLVSYPCGMTVVPLPIPGVYLRGFQFLIQYVDVPGMNRLRQRFPLMPLSWFEICGTNPRPAVVRYPDDARYQDMACIAHDFRTAMAGCLEQTTGQEAVRVPSENVTHRPRLPSLPHSLRWRIHLPTQASCRMRWSKSSKRCRRKRGRRYIGRCHSAAPSRHRLCTLAMKKCCPGARIPPGPSLCRAELT